MASLQWRTLLARQQSSNQSSTHPQLGARAVCRFPSSSHMCTTKILAGIQCSSLPSPIFKVLPGIAASGGVQQVHFHLLPGRGEDPSKSTSCECAAFSKKRADNFEQYIDPADLEPPEVDDEFDEGMSKFGRVAKEVRRMRQLQDEEYVKNKPIFLKAIGLDPGEGTGFADAAGEEEEEEEGDGDDGARELSAEIGNEDDDFYSVLEKAVALRKSPKTPRGRVIGSISKNAEKMNTIDGVVADVLKDDVDYDDVVEIDSEDEELVEEEVEELEEEEEAEEAEEDVDAAVEVDVLNQFHDSSDEYDDEFPEEVDEYVEETVYRMTLAEVLEEANVTPLRVEGDLQTEINGIQHDSREVGTGDMFVCCQGLSSDGHQYASEAVDRGASVLVVSREVNVGKNVGAILIVKDTNSILSSLADAFYGHPSRKLAVVGITGTHGKTTTSILVQSMYEAMGLRTGLLGSIAYYINSKTKLDAPNTTPNAVDLQKLMAKMVESSTEACVMEVSSQALVLDRCKEVDFDVAVFTNLTRDPKDFHETEEDYRAAKGKLFAKMTDPLKHRKVVNLDDSNAPFFVAQGNPDVPVVTYSLENTSADVYALEIQLSLFETELLMRTPKGNIEISSGLLGRHNVYNILATVAVGIAVEAPLKYIVSGIEEIDAIPGRFELIDEEQAFAVIVDYASTPDALARLLDAVRECGAQRVITVVGCGGDIDRGKRPIMAKVATDKSDVCIFTSDNPRTENPLDILDDMLAGVGWSMAEYLKWGENDYYPPLQNGHRVFVYDVRTIAVRCGVAMGEEGDAVVIAGKGHETYQIVGTKEEYFDDREECREALQHLDALHAAGVDTSEFPWRVLESN